MRKKILNLLLLLASTSIFLVSCQKEINREPVASEELSGRTANRGHLKQTKTFSSDVVQQWLAVQTAMLYNSTPAYGLKANRWMAYCGVALYEAVVPGMPAYQSLSDQLNEMPEMPKTEPGQAYHWPTCANVALATITEKIFGANYNGSTGNKLRDDLNNAFQSEIGNDATFTRSVEFGKQVAQKIFDWSLTDNSGWPAVPYTYSYQVGLWWPANVPADQVATIGSSLAYWGLTRTIVPGSINNTASPRPVYSEDPGSLYYQDMLEVYHVSKTLDMNQKIQAKYYNDPGPRYPAGAHYFPILKQVIEQLEPSLDIAALAYAKAGMSLMDASIGSFYAKFLKTPAVTNITERPNQFIKRVLGPADLSAANWVPYIPTPGHPDFPSNHAVFSSSFAHALTTVLGDNVAFSNSAYAGIMEDLGGGQMVDLGTRHYTSFYDMMNDIAFSRLYGGIHTRYACEEGMKQGRKTATNIHNTVKFLK